MKELTDDEMIAVVCKYLKLIQPQIILGHPEQFKIIRIAIPRERQQKYVVKANDDFSEPVIVEQMKRYIEAHTDLYDFQIGDSPEEAVRKYFTEIADVSFAEMVMRLEIAGKCEMEKKMTWEEMLAVRSHYLLLKFPEDGFIQRNADFRKWKMVKLPNGKCLLVRNYTPYDMVEDLYKEWMQDTEDEAVNAWFADKCPSYEEMLLFLAIAEE